MAVDLDEFASVDEALRERAGLAVWDGAFGRQLEVRDALRDGMRRFTLFCGRRGGKTDLLARYLLDNADRYPGADDWTGYVTATQGTSMRNISGSIDALVERDRLPVRMTQIKGQVVYKHDNGHNIWLGGVDDARKADRYRGNAWRGFVVDESGTIPSEVLQYLVLDVLDAALSDYDAPLILAGTPGPVELGFWWEVTTGKGDRPKWPQFSWLSVHNPHHPSSRDPEGFYRALWERHGWDANHVTFRREWLCQWAVDLTRLIYEYSGERNTYLHLPEHRGQWYRVLTIDVGFRDMTTFVVGYSREGWDEIYLEEATGASGMLPADIARTVRDLQRKHGEFDFIGMDPGGGGAMLTDDLRRTYSIGCKAVDRREKSAGIRLVQDGLRRRQVRVNPFGCAQLINEWATLTWNKDHTDHDPNQTDDCSDAAIYNVRAHQTEHHWEETTPEVWTDEWYEAQAAQHEAQLREQINLRNDRDMPRLEKRMRLRSLGLRR